MNTKFQETDDELFQDPILYRQLDNSLIYLTVTRLDIAYTVHDSTSTSHYSLCSGHSSTIFTLFLFPLGWQLDR